MTATQIYLDGLRAGIDKRASNAASGGGYGALGGAAIGGAIGGVAGGVGGLLNNPVTSVNENPDTGEISAGRDGFMKRILMGALRGVAVGGAAGGAAGGAMGYLGGSILD